MNPPQEMAALLEQWRQLTRAESEAILAASWPKLREIQGEKAGLQPLMTAALRQWRFDDPGMSLFRAQISRLIALESHNAQLMTDRQQALRQRQLKLEGAMHQLRKVRHSYAPKASMRWNSYS